MNIFNILPYKTIIKMFDNTLWKYALAGRICYSSTCPIVLFSDPKVIDPDQNREYLRKLALSGHTSVFAHHRAERSLGGLGESVRELLILYAATRFKSYVDLTRNVFVCTFRHVVEDAIKANILDELLESLNVGVPDYDIYDSDKNEPMVILLKDKGYVSYSFILSRVSRVLTHQLVRHTMLDFNQKSDRYTDNSRNSAVIPEYNDSDVYTHVYPIYRKAIDTAFSSYRQLRKKGIKKQDARYILPNGLHTTIMVTGDHLGYKNYFKLRLDNTSQPEIRKVSQMMYDLLKQHVNVRALFDEK